MLLEQSVTYHSIRAGDPKFDPCLYLPFKMLKISYVGLHLLRESLGQGEVLELWLNN